jgi:hypothetical protein
MLRNISLLLALFFIKDCESHIDNCNENSILRITKLELSPDPPIKGEAVYMTVELDNPSVDITDGTVLTTVSVNGFPYPASKQSLCENTACPIVTGFNNRSTESTWPSTVSGRITSKITWTGINGESLLCIEIIVSTGETPKLRINRSNETDLAAKIFKDNLDKKALVVVPMCHLTDYVSNTLFHYRYHYHNTTLIKRKRISNTTIN